MNSPIPALPFRPAVYAQRPMRRLAPLAAAPLLLALAFVLAGCDSSKPGEAVTQPLPSTVVGTLPTVTTTPATVPAEYKNGDPVAGKQVFETAGCSGCHTLSAAGSHGTVGPDLDGKSLPASLVESLVTNGKSPMPSFRGTLGAKQIAAVAAFVSQASKPG